MSDFFARLKSETLPMHKAVEQTDLSRAIMSPNVSLDTYKEYLQRSYTLHHAVEAIIFPAMEGVIKDISSRKKGDSILSDLKELSSETKGAEIPFPEKYVHTIPFQLGMVYVTEGSSLGGLHILRNLKQVLGQALPGRFLNIYGDKTGTMWKSFLAQFEEYSSSLNETEKQEIIEGARLGFERAKIIFEQNTVA